jgi:fatty-acyl-CoA synthase
MTSIRRLLPAPLSRVSAASTGEPMPDPQARYRAALRATPRAPLQPTPTGNFHLPFQRGGFPSLCAALNYAARGATGLNFFDARGTLRHVLPYSQLRKEARDFARRLSGAGIARGERLVLVADTSPDFCIAFFGAQYAGVVPVPVSTPVGLGSKTGYIEQLNRQIVAADASAILAPEDLAAFARTAAADATRVRLAGTMADIRACPPSAAAIYPFGAGERCYVQFSSGSTREPQGIDIRQDQLMANIDGSLAAQQIGETDAGVSWLPLYHDMGLIGFVLAPICAQRSVDLLPPHEFARRPLQWLSMIARRRASITYSPSFGYDLVVRRARTQTVDDLDLSSLRLAGVGADMIQPSILDRFAARFAANGFDRAAFFPSYGMAEVCVGLSFGRPSDGVTVDSFSDPQTGRPRDFVVCGRVLPGHRVEIRDDDGHVLGERQVGRVFVRGPSVMPGYFRPRADAATPIRDGWLDTGDLGYWRADELVVTGRAKDVIIVNGRNVWPQDIEWAVEKLPRLRRGDCCAFSVSAAESEKVIVLVENRPDVAADREALEGAVRQAVMEAVGLDSQVVLIGRQPGLPRTSSGKLARGRARTQFLAGGYA